MSFVIPSFQGFVKPVGSSVMWTPGTLGSSTLKLWLDGLDSSTITHSSNWVTQWSDKSGNNNHATQSAGEYLPYYESSNNLIAFNADWMYLNSTSGISAKSGLFVVRSIDGNDVLNYVTHLVGTAGTTTASYIFLNDGDNAGTTYTISVDGTSVDTGYASVNGATPNPSDKTGTNIVCTGYTNFPKRDEADISFWGINTSRSWKYLAAHNGAPPTNRSKLDIHEVLLFADIPTDSDRQKAEGYVAHKWSITSKLPTGHPYKINPPLL